MKSLIMLALVAASLALAGLAHPFRCGEDNKYLATEGMHKYQILKDCGPPYSREDVGYDEKHGSFRVIEEWVYIIDDDRNSQMYLIQFDGEGIARRIEWLGRQN